jgi:hypothetical protein
MGEDAKSAQPEQLVEETPERLKRMRYVTGHLISQMEGTGVIGPAGEREDDYLRMITEREFEEHFAHFDALATALSECRKREDAIHKALEELADEMDTNGAFSWGQALRAAYRLAAQPPSEASEANQ